LTPTQQHIVFSCACMHTRMIGHGRRTGSSGGAQTALIPVWTYGRAFWSPEPGAVNGHHFDFSI
jgi:hypothetical protein